METQPGISLKHRPVIPDCIHWNEDGQLSICTENGVQIVTPISTGLSSKIESYAHAGMAFPKLKPLPHVSEPIPPDQLQTSYFNEETPRYAVWSPSRLSNSQSCLLTIVTTKHRVLLYQISKTDPLITDWKLFADITDVIEDNGPVSNPDLNYTEHHTLYASWSKAISTDAVNPKLALLALSNKAGDINIWTYTLKNGMQYTTKVTPYKSYVNMLDWTGWKKLNDTAYIAYIVSSSTDGKLALSSVKIELGVDSEKNPEIEDVSIECLYTWFDDNRAIPTLLKVYNEFGKDDSSISIAVSKGVFVYLVSLGVSENGTVSIQGDWASHTLLYSGVGLTGGIWMSKTDFQGYTFEGQGIHMRLKGDAVEEDEVATYQLNQKLIQKYKQQWMEEQLKTEEDDLLGASDALPCLWGVSNSHNQLFTAIYCTMKATVDIHYRVESIEDSVLVFILQKQRGTDVEYVCQELDKYVNCPEFFFVQPIRGIIRETIEFLVNGDSMSHFQTWLKKLVAYISDEPAQSNDILRTLYSTPSMIASLIINNAKIELKHHDLLEVTSDFEEAVEKAKSAIQLNHLSLVLNYAISLPESDICRFSEQDILSILLLSDQALATQNKTLLELAMKVYKKVETHFPAFELSQEISFAKSSDTNSKYIPKPREKCPVCEHLVGSLEHTLLAQCGAGHFWELCSITRRVLAEPVMRKCCVCGSKSLNVKNDNSFTDSVLKQCVKCINCGSGFY